MRYPVAIEIGDKKHSYGVVVPDLVGCYSAGETIDEALENAKEAITLHIDGLLDEYEKVPMPSTIEKYRKNKEFKNFAWAIAEIDPAILDDKVERVNIEFYQDWTQEQAPPARVGVAISPNWLCFDEI